MSWSESGRGWQRKARAALWNTLRTRKDRRVWVVCMYAGLFIGCGAFVGLKTRIGSRSLVAGAGVAIAALSVVVWQLLSWRMQTGLATSEVSGEIPPDSCRMPASPLSQREACRDRAYRRAYQLVVLMALAAGTAAFIVQEELPRLIRRLSDDGIFLVTLFGLIFLLASLPVSFMAWTEPDDAEEVAATPASATPTDKV